MDLQSSLGTVSQNLKNAFKGLTDEMQMCIQNCVECSQICEQMIQHCLKKGGAHAEPNHIRLLQDCAEICQVSAVYMIRESNFHGMTCSICSQVCQACADDCGKLGDDEMMKLCAQVCRRCAASCDKMSVQH